MRILLMIMLLFLFSGCGQKILIKKELLCYDMQVVEPTEEVEVRVHKDDANLLIAKTQELKAIIEFYINQITLYRRDCINEVK